MTFRRLELYLAVGVAIGTILAGISGCAFVISSDYTIQINENTQNALVKCMLAIDAHLDNIQAIVAHLDKQTNDPHMFWVEANNTMNKYPELNRGRKISYSFGYSFAILSIIVYFISLIMYLISLRAVFNDRGETKADKKDKIDADEAKANKYRFDYQ